jgi:hypothetical protein
MKTVQYFYRKKPEARVVAKKTRLPFYVSVALALCVLSAQVQADSLRCGRKVVRSGDAQSRVLQACGKPLRQDSAQELIWSGSKQKTVRVKRWYYKKSSRSLERIVSIYQGKVIAVHTGGR